MWRMQVVEGRETEVEAGETEGDYEAFAIEEEVCQTSERL